MIDPQVESHHYLHSFCVRPKTRFETQESDEEVILILRAHPITQLPWIINTIVAFAVLIFLNIFAPRALTETQIIIVNLFLITFFFAYAWYNFLLYFFNVGIITNKRILDVDFFSILYREISETNVPKIEDITAKSAGYFGSLFNFGNVFIQTAGAQGNIEFLNIPAPTEAVRIINKVQQP